MPDNAASTLHCPDVKVGQLPDLHTAASGRRWATLASEPDNAIWLMGRNRSKLGYIGLYDDGWGASIRCQPRKRGHCWKIGDRWYRLILPGGWPTADHAARALIDTLDKEKNRAHA